MDKENRPPGENYSFQSAGGSRQQEERAEVVLYDSEYESGSESMREQSEDEYHNNFVPGCSSDGEVQDYGSDGGWEKNGTEADNVRELYFERPNRQAKIVPEALYMNSLGITPCAMFSNHEEEAKKVLLGIVMAKGSEFDSGMNARELELTLNQEIANKQGEKQDCTMELMIRSLVKDPIELSYCLMDKENFFKLPMFKDVLNYDQALGTFKPIYPTTYLREVHRTIQRAHEKKLRKKKREREKKEQENEDPWKKLRHMDSCNFLMRMIKKVGDDRREKKVSWDPIRTHYESMFHPGRLCHDIYLQHRKNLDLDDENKKILNKDTCKALFGRSGTVKFLTGSVFAEKIGFSNPSMDSENTAGQLILFLKSDELYSKKEMSDVEASIEELEKKKKEYAAKNLRVQKNSAVPESSARASFPANEATASTVPTPEVQVQATASTVHATPTATAPTVNTSTASTVHTSGRLEPWERALMEKKARLEMEKLEREKTFVKTELKEDEEEAFQPQKPFSIRGTSKKTVYPEPEMSRTTVKNVVPEDSRTLLPATKPTRDSDSDDEGPQKHTAFTDDEDEADQKLENVAEKMVETVEKQEKKDRGVQEETKKKKAPFSFGGPAKKTVESAPEEPRTVQKPVTPANSRSKSPPKEDSSDNDSDSDDEGPHKATAFTDEEDEPEKERETRKYVPKKKDRNRASADKVEESSSEENIQAPETGVSRRTRGSEEDDEPRRQSDEWNRPAPKETKEQRLVNNCILTNSSPFSEDQRLTAYAIESSRYLSQSVEMDKEPEKKEEEPKPKMKGPPVWNMTGKPENACNYRPQMPNEVNPLHEKEQDTMKKTLREQRDFDRLRRQEEERKKRDALEAEALKRKLEEARKKTEDEEKIKKEQEDARLRAQEEERREQNSSQNELEQFSRDRRNQGSGSECRFPPPEGENPKAGVFEQPRSESQGFGKREGQRAQDAGCGSQGEARTNQWTQDWCHQMADYRTQFGSRSGSRTGFYDQSAPDYGNQSGHSTGFPDQRTEEARYHNPSGQGQTGFRRPGPQYPQDFEPNIRPGFGPREPGFEHRSGFESRDRTGGFANQERRDFGPSPTPSSRSNNQNQSFNDPTSPRAPWHRQQPSPPAQRYNSQFDYSDIASEYDHRPPRIRDSPSYGYDLPSAPPSYAEPSLPSYQYDQYVNGQTSFARPASPQFKTNNFSRMCPTPSVPESFFGDSRASSSTRDYPESSAGSQMGGKDSKILFVNLLTAHVQMHSEDTSKCRWSYLKNIMAEKYRNPETIFGQKDWWTEVSRHSNGEIESTLKIRSNDIEFRIATD